MENFWPAFQTSFRLLPVNMRVPLPLLAMVALTEQSEKQTLSGSLDDLRHAGEIPIVRMKLNKPVGALIETESEQKPLTVAQFSEWLHNLYYDEDKKRESAIERLKATKFISPDSYKRTNFRTSKNDLSPMDDYDP
jgi:hypothetical protein